MTPTFDAFDQKMRAEGLPDAVIHSFHHAWDALVRGETGYIRGEDAMPVDSLPDADLLDPKLEVEGRRVLDRAAICKLNGGLGTGMGLQGPKALLPVKDGFNFLDIIAQQVIHLRGESGARLPLLLMNSYSTNADTLQALERWQALAQELPLAFVQNKVPKVLKQDFSPACWPQDAEKEWCPPGHGDIYPSLQASGLLARLLNDGYDYLFVSNSDNLGATLDLRILGHFAESGAPFLMEVADRTPADSKGGHLARNRQGELILRESAQTREEDQAAFQDIERYRFFNTNNLWINLHALESLLRESDGVVRLPLIRNEKPLDPAQPDSPRVYQLESAMGSAISLFRGAQALRVPRTRFAPVKKNSDLLALWSDAYVLTDEFRVELDPRRAGEPPVVTLDARYYELIEEMQMRFPYGAPSLLHCNSLRVDGDVTFGADVTVVGDVRVAADEGMALEIADGSVLTS